MDAKKQALVDALNQDLAYEYQAVLAYTRWSAEVDGPHRNLLRSMFQQEIPDELGHAQYLSDKIAVLGGTPTTSPAQVPDAPTNRSKLEAVMDMEKTAIKNYGERAEQAEELGEIGLRQDLEEMVADETGHYEQVLMMLRGWKDI
jgi:bacterioferritin